MALVGKQRFEKETIATPPGRSTRRTSAKTSSGRVRYWTLTAQTAAALGPAEGEPLIAPSTIDHPLYDSVVEACRTVYDPEIPVNIYDLGLIYGVRIGPDNHAVVDMTLTTPNCPVAESMPMEVEMRVGAVPGVGDAQVNLVWDPPWNQNMISEAGRMKLGMV